MVLLFIKQNYARLVAISGFCFLSLHFIALALSQWRWQSTFISLLQRLYLLPFVCFSPPFTLLPGKLCELNPAPSPSSVTLQLRAGETI